LAACKKNAARLSGWLVFTDESGFLLIPSVCKTWAPRGQTPRLHHRYRRDRLSVHSAIAVSPVRQRLRLFWRMQASNINAFDVADFVRQVLAHLRGHVIVIWDNCSIHKGRHLAQLCRRYPRLHVEPLPSYAPQLNPDEGVWGLAKGTLANGRPDDLTALAAHLDDTLTALSRSPARLRGCITHSELPPFLR
jgi:hypothetical protein